MDSRRVSMCANVRNSFGIAINGNGSYDSANFTAFVAGTSQWITNYSGDASTDPNEGVTVSSSGQQ